MEDDAPAKRIGGVLGEVTREDLYDLSVADLQARITILKTEIVRCEEALAARGASKSAAEQLFKS